MIWEKVFQPRPTMRTVRHSELLKELDFKWFQPRPTMRTVRHVGHKPLKMQSGVSTPSHYEDGKTQKGGHYAIRCNVFQPRPTMRTVRLYL